MAARARWAITAVFAVNGLLIATLAARTPSLKDDLGLSPGQLGLVTAAFGIAAVVAMQGAGALAARFGSRWVVRAAVTSLPVALLGTALARDLLTLAAVHLLFGAVHGLLDVTMNAHAVAVERALGRSILNGCHAAWSIGAVGGSLVAAGAAQFSRAAHSGVLAAVLVPVAAIWTARLLPAATDRGPVVRAARAGWSRPLVVLGAMGATVLTVEAAVANWSGIFLGEAGRPARPGGRRICRVHGLPDRRPARGRPVARPAGTARAAAGRRPHRRRRARRRRGQPVAGFGDRGLRRRRDRSRHSPSRCCSASPGIWGARRPARPAPSPGSAR